MATIVVERGSIGERLAGVFRAIGLQRPLEKPRAESVSVREEVEEVEIVDFKSPMDIYMEQTGKQNPFAWRRRIGAVPSLGSTIQLKSMEGKFEIKDGKVNGIDVHDLTRENFKRASEVDKVKAV